MRSSHKLPLGMHVVIHVNARCEGAHLETSGRVNVNVHTRCKQRRNKI